MRKWAILLTQMNRLSTCARESEFPRKYRTKIRKNHLALVALDFEVHRWHRVRTSFEYRQAYSCTKAQRAKGDE